MTIYIVDIEPLETRYTGEWQKYLPTQMRNATGKEVVQISGKTLPDAPSPNAFLNFATTNAYKAEQIAQIATMFDEQAIKDGDYFLFTDAWNTDVLKLQYMAKNLGVNIKCGGMWHAGSYDENDFLGRNIGDAKWVRHAEKAMFYAYDDNFFATVFHKEMFCGVHALVDCDSISIVGWPMEYLKQLIKPAGPKENIVLFPHRPAEEKQPELFRDLSKEFPDWQFIICQEKKLTKPQYHAMLQKAKFVFSANLQETLGISWYEGLLAGALPLLPDRLSYREMAVADFKYPRVFTDSKTEYDQNKEHFVKWIRSMLERYDELAAKHLSSLGSIDAEVLWGKLGANNEDQLTKLDAFFTGNALYKCISKS